jgi:hypothetical protein
MSAIDSRGNTPEKIDIAEKSLLFSINRTYGDYMSDDQIFAVTYRAWRMSERKNEAKYAFAVYKGIVKGVFTIDSWHKDELSPGRWAFKGKSAPPEIRDRYMGKSVQHYRKHGEANPVLYIHC